MNRFSLLLLYSYTALQLFDPISGKAQVFKNFSAENGALISDTRGIAQDREGFMWFATTSGLYRYDSRSFKRYVNNPLDTNSISSDVLRDVFCDSRGNVWVGGTGGLDLYNPDTDSFIHFRHDSSHVSRNINNQIYCIAEDRNGRILAGTPFEVKIFELEDGQVRISHRNQNEFNSPSDDIRCLAEEINGDLWAGTNDGLVHIPENGGKSRLFRRPSDVKSPLANIFTTIYADQRGSVWLGSNDRGLFRFDTKTERFQLISDFRDENGDLPVVNKIVPDGEGKLWVATESGLAHLDPIGYRSYWYVNRPGDVYSLADNRIYSICLDRQGGVWLGSGNLGLSYFYYHSPRFTQWPSPKDDQFERVPENLEMGKSRSGKLWLISGAPRILRLFDVSEKETMSAPLRLDPSSDYSRFYLDEQDILWAGGNSVLTRVDLRTRAYRDYPMTVAGRDTPVKGKVFDMTEDSRGRFWVIGAFGALLFDKKSGRFKKIDSVSYSNSVFEDSKQNIWIGGGDEVFLLENDGVDFDRILTDKPTFSSNFAAVWRIAEDFSGGIWAVTRQGLQLFNPKVKRFERDPGIAPEKVEDVQIDAGGYFWLSSGSGLVRYHPEKNSIQSYGYKDGLPANSLLQPGSGTGDQHGRFYFTTNKGIFRFEPQKIVPVDQLSPIVFTSLKLSGREVSVGDEMGLLQRDINKMEKVEFKHNQNVFTLDFALLSYFRSDKNRYAYKLEGIDEDWKSTSTPSATYMNLPPGAYVFNVKASNGDGYWTPDPLQLSILVYPPWWKTWYAYTFYMAIAALIIYGITRFFWLRSSFRKENELYQNKLDFFTNVSHEIRTHLSLISGPLEKAYELQGKDIVARNYLTYAKNSTERLSTLVDELLDFRKMENGSVRLQVTEQDVVGVLKSVLAAFEHLSQEKGISTVLESPKNPVLLWFDRTQMQKVFYNLLSNAYKFTQEGGAVTVRVTELSNEVLIKVSDNGRGIAPEELSNIFTNFFQVRQDNIGYGIGLALSKRIVDQHNGILDVESKFGKSAGQRGTSFVIRLLKENAHYDSRFLAAASAVPTYCEEQSIRITNQKSATENSKIKNTILVIEDNDELRAFIREVLSPSFSVSEASNGEEGLELARNLIPDLVLSDVMMPGLNGLEVSTRLKTDMLTCHIPVILLTARSTMSQVIEGLKTGVDDYIVKPFDVRVLGLKIDNLIRIREELKNRYSHSILLDPGELVVEDLDAEFLNKMKKLVVENMMKGGFGVHEIAAQLGMSVPPLYKKLRSLTGMTVNDFVKNIRLKKAKQLLETGDYRVSEVANLVGFEDNKYFSREFKKVFDKIPSEIRKVSNRS